MSLKKKIILSVLAIAVLGGGFIYLRAGGLIKEQVEKIASDALGVAVKIGNIHISLADKSVTVSDIKISNPPGYVTPYAIMTKSIVMTLGQTSRQLIDFKNINVIGSEVYFELNQHGININDLKKLSTRKKQKETAGSQEVRVIVDQMLIDKSIIHPSVSFYGHEIGSFTMPAVHITGIGKTSSTGASADIVIVHVLDEYLTAIEHAVQNSGVLSNVPNMKDLQDGASGVGKKVRGLF